MTKEKVQEISMRVTQSTRTQLVVVTYDIILEDIKDAREAFETGNDADGEKALKQACLFLNELMGSLDYSYPIAYDLLSLYSYVNKRLVAALFRHDSALATSVCPVLEGLRTAFTQISGSEGDTPCMEHVQQVYSGLTYGRGTLNEDILDANEGNRGFFA